MTNTDQVLQETLYDILWTTDEHKARVQKCAEDFSDAVAQLREKNSKPNPGVLDTYITRMSRRGRRITSAIPAVNNITKHYSYLADLQAYEDVRLRYGKDAADYFQVNSIPPSKSAGDIISELVHEILQQTIPPSLEGNYDV